MNEIRKNHIVKIETSDKTTLDGIVFDYDYDRILILISFDSLLDAKKIKELDELIILAYTHLGVKKMKCAVISELNKNNCIVVENNEAFPVEQKREHVRVLSNIEFIIKKDDDAIDCFCINISAGGVAFWCQDNKLNLDDEVDIIFAKEDFNRQIQCRAKIIKMNDTSIVAKYIDLKPFDDDAIVKYVFGLITKK